MGVPFVRSLTYCTDDVSKAATLIEHELKKQWEADKPE